MIWNGTGKILQPANILLIGKFALIGIITKYSLIWQAYYRDHPNLWIRNDKTYSYFFFFFDEEGNSKLLRKNLEEYT